jgi:thymidine phosphorylase
MVAALGGPADIMEHFENHLPLAPHTHEVYSLETGIVQSIDTRTLGIAVIELGGGRRLASDKINHGVGLGAIAGIGEKTGPRERPLAVIYGRDDAAMARAEELIRGAYKIDSGPAKIAPPVRERIGAA